jgi:ABC-2 type transport system ATP-binding protein
MTTVDATRPAPAVVSCRGLTKRFGSGPRSILAVDALDLDIPAGSIFGLLGPNGAGKTTTLRMLTGMARPTSGTATVNGVEIGADDPLVRRSIGALDQAPRFYGWMRGAEVVEFAGRLSGLDGAMLRERTGTTLELVGLAGAARRRVSGYSGGMRQRLGIAAALVAEPSLLILDEPVSSLDPEGRRDLLDLISGLRGSATVILSTHVLDDAERTCDRVAILAAGRLIEEAALSDLLARHAAPSYRLEATRGQEPTMATLRAALEAAPWCAAIVDIPGGWDVLVSDEPAAARELLPMVAAASVSLLRFERVRPTLEDVFLRLVGRPNADRLA